MYHNVFIAEWWMLRREFAATNCLGGKEATSCHAHLVSRSRCFDSITK
ncbi:MAG: hypothetical protein JWN86_2721 [Planctomycetota bacterium]|nr:hypothetical protein [Planctomycetota bacterium]